MEKVHKGSTGNNYAQAQHIIVLSLLKKSTVYIDELV